MIRPPMEQRAHEPGRHRSQIADPDRQAPRRGVPPGLRVDLDERGALLAGAPVLPADHVGGDALVVAVLRRAELGWQGPTDLEAFLLDPFDTSVPFFSAQGFLWLSNEGLPQLRDAIAMGLTTGPIITVLVVASVLQNWRRKLRGESGEVDPRAGTGRSRRCRSPRPRSTSTRTTSVEAVDPAWLAQGVKSPKHLMLDPDNCILCRACEDVCPWNCIYMLSPGIVEDAETTPSEAEVAHRDRDLRGGRQRLHAVLGLRRPVPHRHAVLCAAARGFRGQADDGRGPRRPRRRRMIAPSRERGNAVKLKPPSPSELGDRHPGDRGLEVDLPAGLHLPEGLQGHLARPRARHDEQRPVPPPPREGEAARVEADLHVLPGRPVLLPVHPAHDHRHLPDVLLPADGRHRRRAGVRGHAEHPDHGLLRRPRPQPPPMGRPPHGLQRDPAHGAGVLHRRVQAAARVQLGRGRDPAVPHARPVVHRLPAAVGPAGDLGGHRRDVARRLLAVHREAGRTSSCSAASWWARRRSCAGTCCTCSRFRSCWCSSSRSTSGGSARTAGSRDRSRRR